MDSRIKMIINRILTEKMRKDKDEIISDFEVKKEELIKSEIIKNGFYNLFFFFCSFILLISTSNLSGIIYSVAFMTCLFMLISSGVYFVKIEKLATVLIILEKIENSYKYIYKNIDEQVRTENSKSTFKPIIISKKYNMEDIELDLNKETLNNEEILKYLKDIPQEELKNELLDDKGNVLLINYLNYLNKE